MGSRPTCPYCCRPLSYAAAWFWNDGQRIADCYSCLCPETDAATVRQADGTPARKIIWVERVQEERNAS